MDGAVSLHRRLLHDGYGRHACAILIWYVPLAHKATDMRITDTAGGVRAGLAQFSR
jgi:hypothetical protein